MKNEQDFYAQMLLTADQCGIKILSDDFCCQLLAFLYAFGGESEHFTHNKKIVAECHAAQRRLGIVGGQLPNVELRKQLQARLREVDPFVFNIAANGKIENYEKHPTWVLALFERYNLKPFNLTK